ncbi:ABC transporter permease [Larkinella punicea]|uniref:ABC transporter permease n=1 Tax=Larkinella punicea TaxID=2315727 RepID=A0A368JQG2_9BACT|nr:ABC transporter permease [Larkinella punicea]RCR69917.1 ABC transporter permease [Larkinella punicea]
MNRIRYMVEKEIRQLRRNPVLLRIMILAPIMQLILLSYAANYEVKNLNIAVVDGDHTTYSQRLVGKFRHLDNFNLTGYLSSDKKARQTLLAGDADLVLVIPPHFERDLEKAGSTTVQLLLNAIDGSKAGIANGYATAIIRDFSADILAETKVVSPGVVSQLTIENQYWYNPKLEYKTFMVPGVLFELLLLVGGLVSALNIVREKEIGTMEQLNVTPIRKHEFILGKSIPFVIVGLGLFTVGLLLGRFLFQIRIEGSVALMYVFALLFLILCVGLGLLISTLAENQQQALFVSFFVLVLFILLSGLFASTENMPVWAQWLNWLNPLKYIIEVGRNVMLKGSTFADVSRQFFVLGGMAVGLLLLASWRYRKTV